MKVLYVWDADYPWDIRTEKICSALTAAGHDVHMVARNRAWAPVVDELPEATVHRMPPWRLLGRKLDGLLGFPAFVSPRWVGLIDRTVRRVQPDVIVVRDLPLCPTALWVGRRRGLPVVLDMAENYPAMMRDIWIAGRQKMTDVLVRNPRFVSRVERWCLPRVDKLIVVIEESGERAIAELGVSPERVAVVSNTPPRGRVAAESNGRPDGSPVNLVYLGLMEVPRGVGEVLQALARLRRAGRAVRLTLVGDGRDRELFQRQAGELGLTEQDVEFLGYVPNKQALEIVAAADVGIVPHHADEAWNTTIPNKLFDYMAAGLPVLSSDAVPCARVMRETRAGELFRSRDADDLADAVERLLDPAARRRAAEAGRRAILDRYNWEYDTATLIRTLEEAVAGSASARPEEVG